MATHPLEAVPGLAPAASAVQNLLIRMLLLQKKVQKSLDIFWDCVLFIWRASIKLQFSLQQAAKLLLLLLSLQTQLFLCFQLRLEFLALILSSLPPCQSCRQLAAQLVHLQLQMGYSPDRFKLCQMIPERSICSLKADHYIEHFSILRMIPTIVLVQEDREQHHNLIIENNLN